MQNWSMKSGMYDSVTLLRQFVLPVVLVLLLGACGNDQQEKPGSRGRHARPVELILNEDGRPIPFCPCAAAGIES